MLLLIEDNLLLFHTHTESLVADTHWHLKRKDIPKLPKHRFGDITR